MDSLTRDQLLRSELLTWKALNNVTSSQGSEVGHTHCDLQESQMISHVGQEAHHVSHSALQESNSDSLTKDTSHQLSCDSLTSASLQSSLGSKLRQRLESTGSTIYSLSWKDKVTPAGRQYCQRAASAPRTKEIDCSLVQLTPWPTTCAQNGTVNGYKDWEKVIARKDAGRQQNLQDVVILTSWPTPTANDHKGSGPTVIRKDGKDRTFDSLDYATEQGLNIAAWPTPNCMDSMAMRSEEALARAKLKGGCRNLKDVLHEMKYNEHPIRITDSGQIMTGSDAGMESSGQLNPAHSRWLMGFPPEWDDCAVTATP